jgi:hypothetical protein
MQTAKQVSVSLVNKPGRLATMLAALSKAKVTLKALVVMDSGDHGTVRFVPDELADATECLERINTRYEVAVVLVVDVPSQPGAFRKVCERLAADHLNIDYAYCSFSKGGSARGGSVAVVRVNDLARAQRVLAESPTATTRKTTRPGRRPVYAR